MHQLVFFFTILVDVNIIPLDSLHTYYNNKFALQTYTCSQLCTNYKHTSVVQQYTIFMIISNNQNL
jgi:hypothetical protein